jgi:hypothetical protein
MIICEFCLQYRRNGECGFGLKIPRGLRCPEFDPGVEKFCANPLDFNGLGQIVEMATFFGLKGTEMKKIKQIAAREEALRAAIRQVTA